MNGDPARFEAIGNRLGFRVAEENADRLSLVWQGARFPAFLCLGIALTLLSVSIPIVLAVARRGFEGPAADLWYFPVMNVILFGVAVYLVTLKRTVTFDHRRGVAIFVKRALLGGARLTLPYGEIERLHLGTDQVYGGFAVAGSSAAERFPAPALRLVTCFGATVLIDRAGRRRLQDLGDRIGRAIGRPFTAEPSAAAPGAELSAPPLRPAS
ncbi:MAG TPA: hypothetical protein VNN77_18760 [candidate division Zixibacteria bacterium]|nr:hypothetical protein [candidate division Zixibacteria bacterium]